MDHCGTARFVLRLSSSKNGGGRARFIQSPFTLPTAAAPVERTLATTVALGSFSAALILISPSAIIFSSDFAAERFFRP